MYEINKIKSIYFFPEYYETTSPGCPGDVEFYLNETKKVSGEVLEVGCGLGRVLIPLAKEDLNITGIDNCLPMLNEAKRRVEELDSEVKKRITLEYDDIREMKIKKKFDSVIIPYRTLLHLNNVEEQISSLQNIYDLLNKNGKFIFNIFDPDINTLKKFSDPLTGNHRIFRFGLLSNNKYLNTWATTQCYPEIQTIREIWTYEEIQEGKVIYKRYGLFKIRYIFRYELEHLLKRSGFKIENLYGDFDCSDYKYGRELICICSKI